MTKKLLMPLVATMLGVTSVHAASVTLQMDQVNPDAKIMPEIYGQFAEHLGACIYGGLS